MTDIIIAIAALVTIISGIMTAINTLIGTLIGVSTIEYNKQ